MPIIQATTIGGKLIERGRWEVSTLENTREGHALQLSVNVESKEKNLLKFLGKQESADCVLEREGKSYYVVLTFQIMRYKHLLDHEKMSLQSMAFVVPINRTVEQVLTYMLDRDQCNPKFVELLKNP